MRVRIAALIPARMASSRFPGKPLLPVRGLPMVNRYPAGIGIQKYLSSPPASISSTETFGSAVSRLASTQPAEPAPTMT